ncbi:MAG: kelch repeat-containing protein [Ferruginibacter sp.]
MVYCFISISRAYISAVALNNKIYFAGGSVDNRSYAPTDRIDVFDNSTNSWSTSALNEPRCFLAGITKDDKIYWAGGFKGGGLGNMLCSVEIRDATAQSSTTAYLYKPANWWNSGGQNAVIKNNNIVFMRVGSDVDDADKFDIYDVTTGQWSIGLLPQSIAGASVISVNNTIYVTQGNKVWKLEF